MRGRWLGPIVAGLIVFAAIATLVATGNLRTGPDAEADDTPGTSASSSGQAPDRPLATRSAGSINPREAGGERNEDVGDATDGNTGTGWRTQGYEQPVFGGLKAGVGLILRVDGDTPARRLELDLARAGGSAKVFAADQAYGNLQRITPLSPASALEAELEGLGWKEVAAAQDLERQTTFELKDAGASRFFLVWVTGLAHDPANAPRPWRLEIREARLFP